MADKKSLINPRNDTLAAGWRGVQRPKRAPRKKAEDSVAPHIKADEDFYRLRALYGDQEEEKPQYRGGRKVE